MIRSNKPHRGKSIIKDNGLRQFMDECLFAQYKIISTNSGNDEHFIITDDKRTLDQYINEKPAFFIGEQIKGDYDNVFFTSKNEVVATFPKFLDTLPTNYDLLLLEMPGASNIRKKINDIMKDKDSGSVRFNIKSLHEIDNANLHLLSNPHLDALVVDLSTKNGKDEVPDKQLKQIIEFVERVYTNKTHQGKINPIISTILSTKIATEHTRYKKRLFSVSRTKQIQPVSNLEVEGLLRDIQEALEEPSSITEIPKEIAGNNKLYLISGTTAVGKSGATEKLVKFLDFRGIRARHAIKYTDRKKRPYEEQGVHYHFVEDFNSIKHLLETFYVNKSNNKKDQHHGISKEDIGYMNTGHDVFITVGTYAAAQQLKEYFEKQNYEVVPILLNAPLDALERRLRQRGLPPPELEDRIKSAAQRNRRFLENKHFFKYLIHSDDPVNPISSNPKEIREERITIIGRRLTQAVEFERKNPNSYDYDQYHKSYIDYVLNKIFGVKINGFKASIKNKQTITLNFNDEILEEHARNKGYTALDVKSIFPSKVNCVTFGYGIIGVHLEDPNARAKRNIVLDLIKQRLPEKEDYRNLVPQVTSGSALAVSENALLQEGLLYGLTDPLDIPSPSDHITQCSIGFIRSQDPGKFYIARAMPEEFFESYIDQSIQRAERDRLVSYHKG